MFLMVPFANWIRNGTLEAEERRTARTIINPVEPVSHVPDVVNRRALTCLGGMVVLAPGKAKEGAVFLSLNGSPQLCEPPIRSIRRATLRIKPGRLNPCKKPPARPPRRAPA